ncbi:MAG: amidophosphoribosyltransferase [Patescibacteria group bacterium]
MCGIVGISGGSPKDLSWTVEALTRLNHRGHEAVGISAVGVSRMHHFHNTGYVRDACVIKNERFRQFAEAVVEDQAHTFIGHVRYSTVGPSELCASQPVVRQSPRCGELAFVHNGQLVDYERLRTQLQERGFVFTTQSDSEVLLALIATSPDKLLSGAVMRTLRNIPGAYSMLAMNMGMLVAARDRHGIRPLLWGKSGDRTAFASEISALEGFSFIRELPTGSMVVVTHGQRPILGDKVKSQSRPCIFEGIYFARPDQIMGTSVTGEFRRLCGERLAICWPVEADLVCGVPDSGNDAALGYAERSLIRYEPRALMKNWYSVRGRSFILPESDLRGETARRKNTATRSLVEGKRVVVVDDSLVRATTAPEIVKKLRLAGAKEIHLRIASPPVKYPCRYGIDMPNAEGLLASRLSLEELRAHCGADSLGYLPLEEMRIIAARFVPSWCDACFSGEYPIPIVS